MPAYVIVNVHVTDPELYAEYAAGVPATIERFGGRYLARGGPVLGKQVIFAQKRGQSSTAVCPPP